MQNTIWFDLATVSRTHFGKLSLQRQVCLRSRCHPGHCLVLLFPWEFSEEERPRQRFLHLCDLEPGLWWKSKPCQREELFVGWRVIF